jgi:gluconolactonase
MTTSAPTDRPHPQQQGTPDVTRHAREPRSTRARHVRVLTAAAALAALATLGVAAQQLLPGERPAAITAIPGVIAADATWELIWADFETADGIVGMADGGVIFAQEQTDTIRRIDATGKEWVYVRDTRGAGAVSLDAQGRLFAAQRTCTDTARPFSTACQELPMIGQLLPERRQLANTFPDGRPLVRVNDVMADGKGGAYFTSGGAWHVSAGGKVTTVADQDIRSNGIMLNPDGRTLYVTNNTSVLAFDVQPDGSTGNRREFGALAGDSGADGMAVDSEARLYVTGNLGVHVFSPEGTHLGLIPTPRRPITAAFSGPGKRTLYVPMMGAVGPDGKPWATPEGIRNTAMTIYRIQMLAAGYAGRPK